MPNDWMIYGREKGKGRYRSFDGQGFTNNLIYALRFHPDEGDKVNQVVSQLNHDNHGFEFEAQGPGPGEERHYVHGAGRSGDGKGSGGRPL